MIKDKSILSLVTARAGSKRLPNKNLKPLLGKPLIAYTIEASTQCKYIDRTIVSTDSEEISHVAKQYGADVPFLRPAELSNDAAQSIDVCLHALKWINDHEKKQYDWLCLLQPTSPLRTSKHIEKAVEQFSGSPGMLSLVSVEKAKKHPLWYFKKDTQGAMRRLLSLQDPVLSATPQSELLTPNGAIYLIEIASFLKAPEIYTEKTVPFCMEQQDSIDIDDPFDFEAASLIMRANQKV